MKLNKINHQHLAAGLLVVGVVYVGLSGNASAENQPKVTNSCERKVTLLNNRSRILENYKQSEEKKYQLERQKWAKRIAYSSQWVKGDAEDTRKDLYQYDKLHNALKAEVDKQMGSFKGLETQPLDCSDASKDKRAERFKEVKGVEGKKVVGGQAMIKKLKHEEAQFLNGDFKKSTNKMVTKLHEAKQKHPTPKDKAFEVKPN